jgi:flagellar biosynthetic protein FliR
LNIDQNKIQIFLLILFRVGAILMTLPIFGSKSLSGRIKIGFVFALALFLYPIVEIKGLGESLNIITLTTALIGEMIIGAFFGFTANLIFAAVRLSGQMVGFQMGFAVARAVDPSTGVQGSIVGTFENIVAVLIFLSINAHHIFIRAISESFAVIPPLGMGLSGNLMNYLINISGNMFLLAVKIGAPVIATLLFTNVAFGILSRTAPQIHIMIVAFPLQIAVGFLFVALSLPFISYLLTNEFLGLEKSIVTILKLV